MGKGWAKGLTAATDPRVARAAFGHVGSVYAARGRATDLRKIRTPTPPTWTAEFAYLVGLTATDGCLLSGTRRINFKSRDRDLVEIYLNVLDRTNRIGRERTRTGGVAYKTQFGDAALYEWLRAIGLTPRKSLTLGALDVPDEFLLPVARGLLDGDGSIINKTYRADTGSPRPYYWEYLLTRFISASRAHLVWLQQRLSAALPVTGSLGRAGGSPPRTTMWVLTFGKHDSLVLLPALYRDPNAPCLARKRAIWRRYAERHALAAIQ